MLLDRLLERRLQARDLGAGTGRLEAHHQSILGVLDERHHAHDAAFRRRIVPIGRVGLIARPIASLHIQVEAPRLAFVLIRPTEVGPVEVGRVAVAEREHGFATAQNLGVLAILPAVDLREAIRGREVVPEALPFLFVTGDALGEGEAHVLQLNQTVDARRGIQRRIAAGAHFRQVEPARLEMRVSAPRTTLHGLGREPVRVLDRLRAEIEIDLVHPIPRALVVDERAGSELRDGEKAGARDVLVAARPPAPAGHVRGDREPGEVVAGKEAFRREVPVRVEVPFVDPFGLGEEPDLALGLGAEPPGVVALGLRPGMVADDLVVERALANGRAIEGSPPIAGGIEAPLHLREHLVHPAVVEPGRVVQLGSDFREHRFRPRSCRAARYRIAQLLPERRLHR